MASIAEYHNFSPLMVNELRLGYTRFQQGIDNSSAVFPGLAAFPSIAIQQDLNLQLGAGPNALSRAGEERSQYLPGLGQHELAVRPAHAVKLRRCAAVHRADQLLAVWQRSVHLQLAARVFCWISRPM